MRVTHLKDRKEFQLTSGILRRIKQLEARMDAIEASKIKLELSPFSLIGVSDAKKDRTPIEETSKEEGTER